MKSLIIGGLVGVGVGAGAARMFHAPTVQGMGAFRTPGELNSCEGDPCIPLLVRSGLLLQRLGLTVAAGAFLRTLGSPHPAEWGAAAPMIGNRDPPPPSMTQEDGHRLRHHLEPS